MEWKETAYALAIGLGAIGSFYGLVWEKWLKYKVFSHQLDKDTKVVTHELEKDSKVTDYQLFKDVKDFIDEIARKERVDAAAAYLDRKERYAEDISAMKSTIGKQSREMDRLREEMEELKEEADKEVRHRNRCEIRVGRLEQILIGLGHADKLPPFEHGEEDDDAQPPRTRRPHSSGDSNV